jgi:hypothetical protein
VLFNDVCDRIELLSQPKVPKKENVWYNIVATVRYPLDPDSPTFFVRQFFVFVYVLGKNVTPQTTVETLFVYYLSVRPLYQVANNPAVLNNSQVFCGESAQEPLVASSS